MFELKMGLRNKYFLHIVLLNIFAVLIGYIILSGTRGSEPVTFYNLSESVYTIYTQMGIIIFSPVIIAQYHQDYKEKNISFYKMMNYNSFTYLLHKILMLSAGATLGCICSTAIISVTTDSFRYLPLLFIKLEAVSIYYCIVISVFGFICQNFMLAFTANAAAWGIGILFSSISEHFKFLAYFDANTSNYKTFISFLQNNANTAVLMRSIVESYIFVFILLIASLTIAKKYNRMWFKNGI